MKKWEYLCAYYEKMIHQDVLTELGHEGWELISVFEFNPDNHRWVFKREKVESIREFDVD